MSWHTGLAATTPLSFAFVLWYCKNLSTLSVDDAWKPTQAVGRRCVDNWFRLMTELGWLSLPPPRISPSGLGHNASHWVSLHSVRMQLAPESPSTMTHCPGLDLHLKLPHSRPWPAHTNMNPLRDMYILGYMAFDSFTSNWQGELFSQYKMTSVQMMTGVNLFSCLFTLLSLVEQGSLLENFDFMFRWV